VTGAERVGAVLLTGRLLAIGKGCWEVCSDLEASAGGVVVTKGKRVGGRRRRGEGIGRGRVRGAVAVVMGVDQGWRERAMAGSHSAVVVVVVDVHSRVVEVHG